MNSVLNTSGARLLDGKLDVVIGAPSANQSFSIRTAVPTPRVESKTEGNTHALVKIPLLDAEQSFESRIVVEYTTARLSFHLDDAVFPRPGDQYDDYCRPDRFWETKDPLIRRTAERISRSSHDVGHFLSNAFVWVRENVKLREPQPTRLGAAHAVRELAGDCDELSDLFIAICRAASVPCRRVVGLFYHGRENEPKPFDWHAWAEVRDARDTWIPFDPSLDFFASISERHLPRCCVGRRSDYPIRKLTWRSRPDKSPVLNDDDVNSMIVLSGNA